MEHGSLALFLGIEAANLTNEMIHAEMRSSQQDPHGNDNHDRSVSLASIHRCHNLQVILICFNKPDPTGAKRGFHYNAKLLLELIH